MQLRDSIEIWGNGEGYHDGMSWVPGAPEQLATCPAHVHFSSAALTLTNNYSRFVIVEKLRVVLRDPGIDLEANDNWVVWRGEKYRIDGVLVRTARGKTHHLTLDLARVQ